MIVFPSDESHFYSLINVEHKNVLVDFYADWCEPCKWLDQILLGIESKLPGNTVIVKVDVEKLTGVSAKFQVKGIPVLALFRSGELLWRMNGFLNEKELIQKVKEVLS